MENGKGEKETCVRRVENLDTKRRIVGRKGTAQVVKRKVMCGMLASQTPSPHNIDLLLRPTQLLFQHSCLQALMPQQFGHL